MQVDILGGTTQNIFAYDAMQNRIKKRKVVSGSDISTFYVRDAQGNVLAVYEKNGTTITWKEQHLYGSSRLGTVEPGVAWTTTPAATPYFRSTRILNYGWKRYEVNDHLGNVRALINDRKTYGGATFAATLLDATDYFPFGAEMRKGTVATSYRYGFNGKELDKNGEFGSLNHYDYGFRIYNPGIGRFLSVDPLTKDYPELTPYQFASNTPIQAIDLDGLEAFVPPPPPVRPAPVARAPMRPAPQPSNPNGPIQAPNPYLVDANSGYYPGENPNQSDGFSNLTGIKMSFETGDKVVAYPAFDKKTMLQIQNDFQTRNERRPEDEQSDGYAIIYRYPSTPENRFGHYSVQVITPTANRHTHQIVVDEQSTAIRNQWNPKGAERVAVVDLNTPEKALEYQKFMLSQDLGPYDRKTNSCLTHVFKVLEEGGVPVPDSVIRQYGLAKEYLIDPKK